MAFTSVDEEEVKVVARPGLKGVLRIAICLAIAIPVLAALQRQIAALDAEALTRAFRDIPLTAILTSVALTAMSFLAIARYDLMAMRVLGVPIAPKEAIKGGFIATSISQSLGFGFFTGTLARWRVYRRAGVTLPKAAMISGVVILGFMTGFAVLLAATILLSPSGLADLTGVDGGTIRVGAAMVFGMALILVALSLWQPRVVMFGQRRSIPPAGLLLRQIGLAAADAIPAALAFWVLIPGDAAPAALAVIPVYLTALGLGLASNTPGGVGVLEMVCLLALPGVPAESMFAALILHRAIYFGAPVLMGLSLLLVRELRGEDEPVPQTARPRIIPAAGTGTLPPEVAPILAAGSRAETALALLGDKDFLISNDGAACLMVRSCGNSLIALGDPIGPRDAWEPVAQALIDAAADRFLIPVAYRVGPKFCGVLQRHGLFSGQIGVEAILPLSEFTTGGSCRRELRRKLRQAEKAGITITRHAPGEAPLTEYAAIDAAWEDAKCGARGFSMGLFDPDYLRELQIFEARQDGRIVAFLSVWTSGDGGEVSLDLMRSTSEAPDGTMHHLVMEAITAATEAGAHHFSLCAVPFGGVSAEDGPVERAAAWLYEKRPHWHGSHGLYRFKNAFRPVWQPRYAAASGRLSLAIGAWDTHRLVTGKAD